MEDEIALWGVTQRRFLTSSRWPETARTPGVRGVGKVRVVASASENRIGDQLAFDLAQLADVPWDALVKWGHGW
jgi:hypothetical protein